MCSLRGDKNGASMSAGRISLVTLAPVAVCVGGSAKRVYASYSFIHNGALPSPLVGCLGSTLKRSDALGREV